AAVPLSSAPEPAGVAVLSAPPAVSAGHTGEPGPVPLRTQGQWRKLLPSVVYCHSVPHTSYPYLTQNGIVFRKDYYKIILDVLISLKFTLGV
ncbi:hypothetical protein, partial [Komagataeibacter kakiaceti]|uniref:hypothetical protein n=1 Tax=Komagataeibacter kakiaceti TaxID=943261 RepID=UPI001A7EC51A